MENANALKMYVLSRHPMLNTIFGLGISFVVATMLYPLFYLLFSLAFESHIWSKILALFSSIAVFAEIGVRKLEETKPQHVGVINFFGDFVDALVPAGLSWLPPFCSRGEVNVGEQTIDMPNTEVYVDKSKRAEIHLQAQILITDAYAYVKKRASMVKFSDTQYDAVIESMIGKIKASVRIYCEKNLKRLEQLNEQKEDIIRSVTENGELTKDLAEWGIHIESLTIRTVILPPELIHAANAVEVEERERAAEKIDVATLGKIGKRIKKDFGDGEGFKPKELLEAAQLQQKRISALVMRGRGMPVVDMKDGK